jgi:hypothetical protein
MFSARKKILVLVSFCMGLTGYAYADGAKASKKTSHQAHHQSLHDQFTGQQYGMAGCGLGSVVFADKPGMIQIIAATLNGTAGNQTFGISSGTSNCGASGAHEDQAKLFIEVNQQALAKDVSRGRGEALDAFAKIVGCQSQNLGPALKKNYTRIFSNEANSSQTSQAIFGVIRSDSKLQQCSTLGVG